MCPEAGVERPESRQEALEHAFIENNKLPEATHGVVSLILNDQLEMRKEQLELRYDVRKLHKGQSELKQRFDQLELLIRQYFTQS